MGFSRLRAGAVIALAAAVLAACAGHASAQDPCRQIRRACQQAGFQPGGARTGAGLAKDCYEPIVNGAAPPSRTNRALPQVDSQIVAACKASGGPPATQIPASTRPVQPLPPKAGRWPDIVMILVDDYSLNLMAQSMPNLATLQRDGVTFALR